MLAAAGKFERWGVDHLLALLLICAATTAIRLLFVRSRRSQAAHTAARAMLLVLAVLIMLTEIAGHVWRLRAGIWNIQTDLPLHLCDLTGFLVAWISIERTVRFDVVPSPLMQQCDELAYFWALAGSTQALLTPDLVPGFPSFAFWEFFVGHGTAWITVVAMVFGGRLTLRPRAFWSAWGLTIAIGAVVGLMNALLGSNYMYTCGSPGHSSIYDYLGPWPLSLLSLSGLGLCLFWLCQLVYDLLLRPRLTIATIAPQSS